MKIDNREMLFGSEFGNILASGDIQYSKSEPVSEVSENEFSGNILKIEDLKSRNTIIKQYIEKLTQGLAIKKNTCKRLIRKFHAAINKNENVNKLDKKLVEEINNLFIEKIQKRNEIKNNVIAQAIPDEMKQDEYAFIAESANNAAQPIFSQLNNNICSSEFKFSTISMPFLLKELEGGTSVEYFDENRSNDHKLTFSDGKLVLPKGVNRKGDIIYVMNPVGEFFVVNKDRKVKEGKLIKHSSLFSGADVAGAGYLEVSKDGFCTKVNNKSGHYKPTIKELEQVKTALNLIHGVDVGAIKFKDKSKK